MIDRFRMAIRRAGGVRVVAEKSGVPKGTLDNLLGGTEIRFTAAYAVSVVCEASLDWLATGKSEFWPDWYRAQMTGTPYTFPEGGHIAIPNPGYDHPPRDLQPEGTHLSEPPAQLVEASPSIDVEQLRQAIDIVLAVKGQEGQKATDFADKVAEVYDILTGAKP